MTRKGVRGAAEVFKKLKAYEKDVRHALGFALQEEGQAIMAESVRECPVEYGNLRASHYVSPHEVRGNDVKVTLSYGTEYAVHVHENLNAKHAAPTKSRFLSDPANAAKRGMKPRLRDRMKRYM